MGTDQLASLGLSDKSEGDDNWPALLAPAWAGVLARPSLRPTLLSAARRALPYWDEGQIEDVVQSVLERQLLRGFPGGCPRAYLRVVTRHAALAAIDNTRPLRDEHTLHDDVEALVAANSLREVICRALSGLPEVAREWLRRVYLEGEHRDSLRKTFGLTAWEARTFDANILLILKDELASQGWEW